MLLLSEAEEMITTADSIQVFPCNCKILAGNCGFSREVCLGLWKGFPREAEGREIEQR